MKRKIVYTDGSGSNGSEYGRYCYWIKEINIARLFQKKGITNNEAEYLAIVEAVNSSLVKPEDPLLIYSDSQVVVNQLNKKWNIKSKKLRKLFIRVLDIINERGLKVKFKWLRRSKNYAGHILG